MVHGGVSLKLPVSRSVAATGIGPSLPDVRAGPYLSPASPPVGAGDDPAVGHGHALGPQAAGVVLLVAGHQAAGRGHDAPPGHVVVGRGEDAADGPGGAGEPGLGGHLAVGHDLARAK